MLFFERYGVTPVYVINSPVANQPEGYQPLKDLLDAGCCEIGTHLQPWVKPPFAATVSEHNSFPGNLLPVLEREKLRIITDTIEDHQQVRHIVYQAGRYGVGEKTAGVLEALGYDIDVSVMPSKNLTHISGPNFSRCGAKPYWVGPGEKLPKIPLAIGHSRFLTRTGSRFQQRAFSPRAVQIPTPGVLARQGFLERIFLTPEGVTHKEHRQLTAALLARGQRIFSFTYQSLSLVPGHTPYVRNKVDLSRFIARIERYLNHFIHEVGGGLSTPPGILALSEFQQRATQTTTA